MPLLVLSLSSASEGQGLRLLLLVLLVVAVILLISGGVIAVWTLRSYHKATVVGPYDSAGGGNGQTPRFEGF
ncbi:hypothetical protein [Thermogemmatispora sp.]|uniref:hypothetical protein n=1 Tax=Thermogemmatispora sp. TaxID=1968838 RepID=UPI001D96489D|nr:hypothetical protein [Thermogemmatispora sp.]MBX5449513.1 hypothetical protein [Thermogemmatispora sp.]